MIEIHAEFRQAECQTRYFGQHQRPTFTKYEFPRFDTKDIPFWLWKCERYFSIAETPKEDKVKMASIHLDERTFLWHWAMERRWQGCLPQWEEYAVLLQDRFGPSFESPISKIIRLQQTGLLTDFNSEWDLCMAKINLPEEYLVDAYMSALKPELEKHVRMFKPRNLLHARRLARMQEIILEKQTAPSETYTSSSFNAIEHSVNTQKELGNHENPLLYMDSNSKPSYVSVAPALVSSEHNSTVPNLYEEALRAATPSAGQKLRLAHSNNSSISTRNQGKKLEQFHSGGLNTNKKEKYSMGFPSILHSLRLKFSHTILPNECSESDLKKGEKATWQEEAKRDSSFTCMQNKVEKSNCALQLACTFRKGKIFSEVSGVMDIFFKGIGPKWLQSWFLEMGLQDHLFTWVFLHFSPTRVLILQWFKGELITMLMGGFCSLCRKEKKQVVQQYSSYDKIRRIFIFQNFSIFF